MFASDFESLVTRLRFNDCPVHLLRNIYSILTGFQLVGRQDFEAWFANKVHDLDLLKDVHYRYRYIENIDNVFVRGSVGLNMILSEDSPLGEITREICNTDRVPMRQRGL